MIDPAPFVFYLLAAGAMILSPGPDSIYVLTRSVSGGRYVGVASAVGISVGVLLHTLAVVLGLAALFRASPVAFVGVTYLGAAYLVYLGVRTIREGVGGEPVERDPSGDGTTIENDPSELSDPFVEAITVNVLNPQVAIFFLAFLPQFVGGDWIEIQLAFLGGTYAVLTMLYLGSVALAASAFRSLLAARPAVADGLSWISGLVLIGLGLRLFLVGP